MNLFKNRRNSLNIIFIMMIIMGLVACSQKAPSAQPEKTQTPQANKAGNENKIQPTDNNAKAAWSGQADWDKIVESAIKEGKLVVSAPTGKLHQDVIVAFQKDYPKISVEITPGNSRDFFPRLDQERKLGKYLWDLRVGGPDPQVYAAINEGKLDSIRPLLVLPEVTDDSKWRGGLDAIFADKQKKYIPGFMLTEKSVAFVNRDIIPKSELDSIKQLTDPKYKGKIIIQDPRGGAGLGSLSVLYIALGENFVKDFLSKQNLVVSDDARQVSEWVIRGKYPIGIGVREEDMFYFKSQGVNANLEVLQGPAGASIGSASLALINKAPHPNAAKVFVNWILTKKVQEMYRDHVVDNSRRVDVGPGNPDAIIDDSKLDQFVIHQEEKWIDQKEKAAKLASEILK